MIGLNGFPTKEMCKSVNLKDHSHDPILRIRFLVPKIGSRRSDSPISRYCFCGENVGRSFEVCSHYSIFRTDKESSIWRQNDHREIMQHLSAPFIFQEECPMKIEHVLFPSVFSKLQIRVSESHFQFVQMIRFPEPTKIGSLKTDHVNGPLHGVLKATFHLTISIRWQHARGKIQRNNYHHGSCGHSLTGKTPSMSLIFTYGTHRNVKNR